MLYSLPRRTVVRRAKRARPTLAASQGRSRDITPRLRPGCPERQSKGTGGTLGWFGAAALALGAAVGLAAQVVVLSPEPRSPAPGQPGQRLIPVGSGSISGSSSRARPAGRCLARLLPCRGTAGPPAGAGGRGSMPPPVVTVPYRFFVALRSLASCCALSRLDVARNVTQRDFASGPLRGASGGRRR